VCICLNVCACVFVCICACLLQVMAWEHKVATNDLQGLVCVFVPACLRIVYIWRECVCACVCIPW
jgi:F0F1-type ATP synthase assembly protein I